MSALPKLKTIAKGKFFFCIAFILTLNQWAVAQENLKIGQWQSHLPYQRAHYLAQSESTIYASTEWSVFTIDKESDEVNFMSKVEGLSDIAISQIKYDSYNKRLIVIYVNSNIDIINEQSVANLPFILKSNIVGDKKVYDVFVENASTSYMAMGFGLKVLNVIQDEDGNVEYFFGDETKAGIRFNSVVVYNNSIYASTEEGIYRFDRSLNVNIQDFGAWELLGPEHGFPLDYNAQKLTVFKDAIYTNIGETLYRYDGTSLDSLYAEEPYYIHYLNGDGNRLIVGLKCCIPTDKCDCSESCVENCNGKTLFFDADASYIANGSKCVNRARYAIEDEKGQIWYGDSWKGLRKSLNYEGDCNTLYQYSSPRTELATEVLVADNNVWVATELHSPSPDIVGDGYFSFVNGQWYNYSNVNNGILEELYGFITLAVNPANKNVYIGTVYDGIIEMTPDEGDLTKEYKLSQRFNGDNSTLQVSADPNVIRVTGMAFDNSNNLWVANHTAQSPISVLKSDGTWQNDFLGITSNSLRYLVVDQSGYKWFAIDGAGQALLVYDDNGTIDDKSDDRFRTFNSGTSELPNNAIRSISVDLDGDVWVGTTEGVVIFECGGNVFDSNCRGSRRILEVGGFNGHLLETEEVTAIAVDGANRKWVGTGNGLFVFTPSGEEQLAFFDKNNSPLFDNQINSIAINSNNGEVFIGTAKGLISYRSDALAGGKSNSGNAYAYPNPVRPNYDGPIAIKGLARDANVKITDVNGQLVYETTALGGQAIWDGKDYQGRKANTGVYLVFSTNTRNLDTPDAIVAKILFVN